MKTYIRQADEDCQRYIDDLCDGDRRLGAKASLAIDDANFVEVSSSGQCIFAYNWSAPWIVPSWEYREILVPL